MSPSYSILSVDEIFQELNQSPDAISVNGQDSQYDSSNISSPVCNGWVQRWSLRSGLSLMIRDLEFVESVTLEREHSSHPATLGLSFCVAGQVKSFFTNPNQAIQLQAGQASLGSSMKPRQVEYMAQQRVRLAHIHIHPTAINLLSDEMIEQIPSHLQDWFSGISTPSYFHSCAMTPVMKTTVWQLLNCPYQGLAKRFYLEGKTFELIGLYLDQILNDHGLRQNVDNLPSDHVERIFQARDLLVNRIANPPRLIELAHQVGLNDRKLKEGFRSVFGTTVFNYLRNYQMEQSKQLLLTPGTTIASVAQAVGYRSPEAFSVAFRRTFNLTPKTYQMQHR
ncbi:transcriptional regulator, AraC family [Halothece sp. PCC 7418]|uniref:helix-turn-helix transcriptional regulator n=1 Tax=Halothece sp. (strain PCC 7418) TaxID=65093 RepID=UPI0002A07EF5|nr:AraC family transcriptional regulator [Halothece sp. PCC 7418]AFZ42413.1 transcriptional regulator, AraC family [Halothece sp. PCC 7418]